MRQQPQRPVGRVNRRAVFLFVLCVLLFHISGYVGNEMANATFSATMAIVETGSPEVEDYSKSARERSWYNGRLYSGMPPGQSFVAVPLYFVLRPAISVGAEFLHDQLPSIPAVHKYALDELWVLRRLLLVIAFTSLVAMPAGALTCLMVVDLARKYISPVSLAGALLLPIGTIWWTYSTEYGPRIMGGFFLLLPIWWLLLRREDASTRTRWIMAAVMGAGIVLTPLIRYEMIFGAAPVAIWALSRLPRRRRIAFAAAAVIFAAVGMAYHAHCYGGPFTMAYSQKVWSAGGVERIVHTSPEQLRWFEFKGKQYVVWNQQGILSFTPRVVAEGLWRGKDGLLRFSPFFVLTPVGLWLMARKRANRKAALLLSAIVVSSIAVLALMPHPGTRGSVGPRYILWCLPAATILALAAFRYLPWALRWLLVAASFAPSYLAAMLGSHTGQAWSFGQIAKYGLTNYTLSRAQEAGLLHSPLLSTVIVLVFWIVILALFFQQKSRLYLFDFPNGAQAESED